jgi:AcrR family transcriptional regulator
MTDPEHNGTAAGAATGSEPEARAVDGRVPGRRGMATRQRLLECTSAMVKANAYRDVKVVDIAREAGTSPATFYQYFADVESAVLALAEQLGDEGQRFADVIASTTWRGADGFDAANELDGDYLQFWEDHRPVLKVNDMATSEGDVRFRTIRTSFLAATAQALREAIAQMQHDGRHPDALDPAAMSGVLVSMLANVAAHRRGLEDWGVEAGALRDAMARIIFWAVSGQKPRSSVGG